MCREIGIATLVLYFALLSGCSPNEYEWRDTSGKGRPTALALKDKQECYRTFPGALGQKTDADRQAGLREALDCMRKRGWIIVDG
jgi:hypothetical protein